MRFKQCSKDAFKQFNYGINLLGSSEQKGFSTAPLQSDLFAYEMSYPFIILS